MSDVLKTWPAFMERRKVLKIFTLCGPYFWFVLSRGKPQRPIERLYFTHQGEIIGHFQVEEILCNTGDNIPKLRSLENHASEWQIKRDRWVAKCPGPFVPLHLRLTTQPGPVRIYHDAFRGFRYFDFEAYTKTMESKIG
jgi:hypothetical protein